MPPQLPPARWALAVHAAAQAVRECIGLLAGGGSCEGAAVCC